MLGTIIDMKAKAERRMTFDIRGTKRTRVFEWVECTTKSSPETYRRLRAIDVRRYFCRQGGEKQKDLKNKLFFLNSELPGFRYTHKLRGKKIYIDLLNTFTRFSSSRKAKRWRDAHFAWYHNSPGENYKTLRAALGRVRRFPNASYVLR